VHLRRSEGKEHVPTDQAVLYIGNHRRFFDIVITYAQCPNLTGYISKDGVNKVPLLGIWMRRLYCLFLDRKDLKQGLKTIPYRYRSGEVRHFYLYFPGGNEKS